MRVIGYVRVSTKEQGDTGHGLGAQTQALQAFCATKGYELLTITSDVVSGGNPNAMYGREIAILGIENGVADALLVRALDRATRDQLDHATLFKRAERYGWRLMDCEGADSGVPSARLTADIRNVVAAEERRKISERTREALAKARKYGTKSGKPIGRPVTVAPDLAERIAQMGAEGLSPNKIAATLTQEGVPTPRGGAKWYPTTVSDVLRRAA
jgi:DNA invertase Pin-like site-specific DNA recombinase